MTGLAERYREISHRVAEAAARSGRRPESITLIAAAKTFGVDAVSELFAAGGRDVGENYVQEAKRKAAELPEADLRWHLIGHLQRNKVSTALDLFHLIHTLDSIDLGRELDRVAGRRGLRARCLVEVNLANETTKAGVDPDGLPRLVEEIGALQNVDVMGLMTVPPRADVDRGRSRFAKLRELAERLSRLRPANVQFKELSMGMSADFEVAIEEGATMVRVGTSIFGPRGQR